MATAFPPEIIEITIASQKRDYSVAYPNAGQQIDIEKAKILLSDGMYSDLINARMKSSLRALDSIDTMAFFENAIPDFRKDLGLQSLKQLKAPDMAELIIIYTEKIAPWLAAWELALAPKAEVAEE